MMNWGDYWDDQNTDSYLGWNPSPPFPYYVEDDEFTDNEFTDEGKRENHKKRSASGFPSDDELASCLPHPYTRDDLARCLHETLACCSPLDLGDDEFTDNEFTDEGKRENHKKRSASDFSSDETPIKHAKSSIPTEDLCKKELERATKELERATKELERATKELEHERATKELELERATKKLELERVKLERESEKKELESEKKEIEKKCESLEKECEDWRKKCNYLQLLQTAAELREILLTFTEKKVYKSGVDQPLMKMVSSEFPRSEGEAPANLKLSIRKLLEADPLLNEETKRKLTCLRDAAKSLKPSSLPWWDEKKGELLYGLCFKVVQWNKSIFHPKIDDEMKRRCMKKAREGGYKIDGEDFGPLIMELLT